MLKLYDTYKKKLVEFKPIEKGKAKIYHCGPTVYDDITIGNIRSYIFRDFLYRILVYLGYEVEQVMNITDVGHLTMTDEQKLKATESGKKLEITDTEDGLDRMEKAARREGMSVWDVAKKYTDAIFGKGWEKKKEFGMDGDFGKMNIIKQDHLPKATDLIQEQIDFIKVLEEKGFAYTTKHAVYFDISKFPKYEELTGQSFDEMQRSDKADTSDPDRKHPADFRLWQLNQPDHAMQWDSPWGKGYPGWHIECSVMSRKYLGQPIDIHTGGEDHIKVHHPAEIAQSESAFDKPLANYWMHNAFLTVDGGRMGKSLGNAYTLQDVIDKGFDPMDLRYFFFCACYRTKQNFTWKCLENNRNSRLNLIRQIKDLINSSNGKEGQISQEWKQKFVAAIEDDLNMPKALAVVWDMIKSNIPDEDKLSTVLDFDKVLGLRLDKVKVEDFSEEKTRKIEKLVKEREEARKGKDWDKADEIRDRLREEYSVEVKDKGDPSTSSGLGSEWAIVE